MYRIPLFSKAPGVPQLTPKFASPLACLVLNPYPLALSTPRPVPSSTHAIECTSHVFFPTALSSYIAPWHLSETSRVTSLLVVSALVHVSS